MESHVVRDCFLNRIQLEEGKKNRWGGKKGKERDDLELALDDLGNGLGEVAGST
jgi:hypothetical protein